MLSPDREETAEGIQIRGQEPGLFGKGKTGQKLKAHQACQKHFSNMRVDQKIGDYAGAKQGSAEIQDNQGRIKQTQLQKTGAEPVIEIPEGEISVRQMVGDGIVMHDILLLGVGTDIVKEKDRVPEEILVIYQAGRGQDGGGKGQPGMPPQKLPDFFQVFHGKYLNSLVYWLRPPEQEAEPVSHNIIP